MGSMMLPRAISMESRLETGSVPYQEILEKKDEFAHLLLDKCEETIKIRTLGTCYATFYCVLQKLFTIFEDVWAEKVRTVIMIRN